MLSFNSSPVVEMSGLILLGALLQIKSAFLDHTDTEFY